MPAFSSRQGNWRPDYLLEKVFLPDGSTIEKPRVCEINSRFPWNGIVLTPCLHGAQEELGIAKAGLKMEVDRVSWPNHLSPARVTYE